MAATPVTGSEKDLGSMSISEHGHSHAANGGKAADGGDGPDRRSRLAWAGLWGFALVTTIAVVGYGTFGLHPGLLPDGWLARTIFPISYALFARLHILIGAVALGLALTLYARAAWVTSLLLVCLVSFLAEHVGTGVGLPFGEYRYTGLLGPKIAGRVPALVPLSWYLMAVPAYAFALRATDVRGRRWVRAALAASFLVVWDLALDPAMSFLTPYWSWGQSGPYYGMPWINLFGWLVTGLGIAAAFELLGSERWIRRVPLSWLAAFSAAVIAMPLGMLVAAGKWPAVGATLVGASAWAAVGWTLTRPAREHVREHSPATGGVRWTGP